MLAACDRWISYMNNCINFCNIAVWWDFRDEKKVISKKKNQTSFSIRGTGECRTEKNSLCNLRK